MERFLFHFSQRSPAAGATVPPLCRPLKEAYKLAHRACSLCLLLLTSLSLFGRLIHSSKTHGCSFSSPGCPCCWVEFSLAVKLCIFRTYILISNLLIRTKPTNEEEYRLLKASQFLHVFLAWRAVTSKVSRTDLQFF